MNTGTLAVGRFIASARARAEERRTQLAELSKKLHELRAKHHGDGGPPPTERTPLAPALVDDVEEELRVQDEELDRVFATLEKTYLRYADLFLNAPEAYVTTDKRGTIEEANGAAANLLGMPASFLVGRCLLHFVARADTRVFRAAMQAVASGAPSIPRLRVHMRPRHKLPMEVEVAASAIEGPARVVGVRWILRDAPRADADACSMP